MQTVIEKLRAGLSANAKIAAIEKKLLARLRSDIPLSQQQQLKPLWYRERIELVLRGKYYAVAPVNLELVPSLDCNYLCPHCTYNGWKKRTAAQQGQRQASYSDLLRLLDRIEAAGVRGVTVTGGGEPLANAKTIRALEYAAGKTFAVGLFTNGSLLNADSIGRLASLNLSFVRISINSGEERSYLKFHGLKNPALFAAVRRNIALLGRALHQSRTTYGLAVIVNEVNVDQMASVAEFVRELYEEHADFRLDYVTYRPVINYGQIDSNLQNQITPDLVRKALNNFQEAQAVLAGFPVSLKMAYDYFAAAGEATQRFDRGYGACIGNAWCGSVAYDGGLYLCSERDGNLSYLMGNLLQSPLDEIWASEQRANVLKNIAGCPPACKVHRFNQLLHDLLSEGALHDLEIAELQSFLDVLRAAGEPDQLSFLSF